MSTPLFTLNPAQMLQEAILKLLTVQEYALHFEANGANDVIEASEDIVSLCLLHGTGLEFKRLVGLLYGYSKEFDTFTTVEGFTPYDYYWGRFKKDLITHGISQGYGKIAEQLYFTNEVAFRKIYNEDDHASLVIMVYNDFKAEGM